MTCGAVWTALAVACAAGCGRPSAPASSAAAAASDAQTGGPADAAATPADDTKRTANTDDSGAGDALAAADIGAVDAASDVPADDLGSPGAETAGAEVAQPVPPGAVLFIGNSYTYVNDLPAMAAAFAAHAAPPQQWQVDSVTLGGARLIDHMTKTNALARIAEGTWTWVILQGQSVEPALDPPGFLAGAKGLSDAVHKTTAQLGFYSTWPRKAGDALYAEAWSGGTPAALYAKLKTQTQKAADQNGAIRVPVADAWMALLAAHPEIELYQADGSHPTTAGTYLAACVFARVLGGVHPDTVTWRPDGLDDTAAAALRKACQ